MQCALGVSILKFGGEVRTEHQELVGIGSASPRCPPQVQRQRESLPDR